ECAQAIEHFAEPGFVAQAGDFEEVARKLSALGFFAAQLQGGSADIDAILEPPAAPKPVIEPDQEAETVETIIETELPAPVPTTTKESAEEAVVADEATLALEPEDLAEDSLPQFEVEGFETPTESEAASSPKPIETPAPSAEASRLVEASQEDLDAELLSIFLEEANEVLATINETLPLVHATPGDQASLVTLRRSFHTLKGSGRMVGLTHLGEAAWAVEQVMNGWLHEVRAATPELLEMLDLAAGVFLAWVKQLETGGSSQFDDLELARLCRQLGGAEDAEADVAVVPAPTFEVPTLETPEPETPTLEAPALEIPEPEALTSEAPTTDAPVADAPVSEEPAPEEPVPEAEEEIQEDAVASVSPSAEVVSFPAPPSIRVGEVEVPPSIYNLYLEETREHIATLQANLGLEEVPGNDVIRAAHTTASISAAAGFAPISGLARALEDVLVRYSLLDACPTDDQRFVFARCAGALEGMLGAIAERRMPQDEAELTAELNAMKPAEIIETSPESFDDEPVVQESAKASPEQKDEETAEAASDEEIEAAKSSDVPEININVTDRRTARIEDEIDLQILPLFLEESVDLMREVGSALREWRADPGNTDIPRTLQRALHTLKGSARMAGAMGCGELLHSMEDRIDQATSMNLVQPKTFDGLEISYDRAAMLIENLRNPPARQDPADARPLEVPVASVVSDAVAETGHEREQQVSAAANTAAKSIALAQKAQLRVRADLVDQLVNEAGEVAIARGRIEGELLTLKISLLDLTENVIRLRKQLREVEIQAESQMQSQQALASERAQEFDPLEFDRFTRFQEVSRMMAESVNDVATVQQTLMRSLDLANAAVAAQARLNRELSQRLMGVRMVPFESLAERLHRVVRQAAKDSGKRCNLDIRHGQTELDRSVLDKMAGPLEHMLRNSVAHGLESTTARVAAGKEAIGQITVSLAQEGNEIVIIINDDGAGLDFDRIRQRGLERGLINANENTDEATLSRLILQPGFSTAEVVTALAGRGVGMDVVESEAASLGGRVEIKSITGSGTTFRIYLPLTLSVTQAVLVTYGNRSYAIPSSMIEQATEQKPEAAASLRSAGSTEWLGHAYPYRYLGTLLGDNDTLPPPARRHWILLIKGGTERVALEVDSLSRNQEIVVKAVGPQLARVRGLSGATVLGNGEVALIINPVALASRATDRASTPASEAAAPIEVKAAAASVMVVDDSLTVRKIGGRLLARHGYHVLTAKDGVDALEQLSDEIPDVMLLDIEMPRMDGFDLARNIRGDERLKHIPIIMITSRTADKHRQHAAEIGVDHYLGKPYDEDELLTCIRECIGKK
ncbi:MAG: Hpt domain-containing protein, partial [Sulfuritalea sp.]|nr:Hpt domain-containing protein [Sulfuritalea sp.]